MVETEKLEKAIESLSVALEIYDCSLLTDNAPEKIVLRDGVIQRFEFTIELSWKTLKRFFEEFGMEMTAILNNRDFFRIAFEEGLINDPRKWLHYLRMRNQTSHIYNEAIAAEVFRATREFAGDVQALLNELKRRAQ